MSGTLKCKDCTAEFPVSIDGSLDFFKHRIQAHGDRPDKK